MSKGFFCTQFPSKLSKKKKKERERQDYLLRNSKKLRGSCQVVRMLGLVPTVPHCCPMSCPQAKEVELGEVSRFLEH